MGQQYKVNNKGFSIIQVLIALGLSSVLSLFVAGISRNASKTQAAMTASMDLLALHQELTRHFTHSESCRVTLSTNMIGSSLSEGDSLLQVSRFFEPNSNHLIVGSLKRGTVSLQSATIVNLNNNVPVGQRGIASVEVELEYRRPKVAFGPEFIRKRIPIQATIQNNGGLLDVESCSDEEGISLEEMACKMAGKFYFEGQTPSCRLSKNIIHTLAAIGTLDGGHDSSTLSCPKGMGIIGMNIHHAGRPEALSLLCGEINIDTLKAIPSPNSYQTAVVGKPEGHTFSSYVCPEGAFVAGVAGNECDVDGADRLCTFRILCRDYATNVEVSNSPLYGYGLPVENFRRRCQSNTILRELMIKAGSEIDYLKAGCW